MAWEPMKLDEYAAFQVASGAKVVSIRGTWWTEVRPFFFRPLFPFDQVAPEFGRYPFRSLVGGVLHPVPEGFSSNSQMHLFVYDRLEDYALEGMAAKQRWIVKKGVESFSARRITDLDQFVAQAAPIYHSFYARTGYVYKRERTDRRFFAAWARPLFQFRKVLVTGAYREERLCAVDISYQVEDIVIDDVFFSDTESQSLRVTDFLLHVLREGAKESGARFIFRGFPTGKQTLDESKTRRGCRVLKLPAHCRINPLAFHLGRAFMNESYRKLVAITSLPGEAGSSPVTGSR